MGSLESKWNLNPLFKPKLKPKCFLLNRLPGTTNTVSCHSAIQRGASYFIAVCKLSRSSVGGEGRREAGEGRVVCGCGRRNSTSHPLCELCFVFLDIVERQMA